MNPPESRALALKTLTVARGFVGISRANDRKQVTKFLNLFGLDFADSDGKPFPYCAAGASYAMCKAYALLTQKVFAPANSVSVFKSLLPEIRARYVELSPSCAVMISDARARHKWEQGAHGILPGDFVYFDWQGDGKADHVEICLEPLLDAHDHDIKTVGFNTSDADASNGGAVAQKVRPVSKVVGYIRM